MTRCSQSFLSSDSTSRTLERLSSISLLEWIWRGEEREDRSQTGVDGNLNCKHTDRTIICACYLDSRNLFKSLDEVLLIYCSCSSIFSRDLAGSGGRAGPADRSRSYSPPTTGGRLGGRCRGGGPAPVHRVLIIKVLICQGRVRRVVFIQFEVIFSAFVTMFIRTHHREPKTSIFYWTATPIRPSFTGFSDSFLMFYAC